MHLCPDFAEVWRLCGTCAAVMVDMPIGLADKPRKGGRVCDQAARALLGRGRASSVFSAPSRQALGYHDYGQLRRELPGHGVTIQAFHLFPGIREIDACIGQEDQSVLGEAHPELAFMSMNGAPLPAPKRSPEGLALRRRLVMDALGLSARRLDSLSQGFQRSSCREDDCLDAMALAWVAGLRVRGQARRVPEEPPVDAKGLRMEIWY